MISILQRNIGVCILDGKKTISKLKYFKVYGKMWEQSISAGTKLWQFTRSINAANFLSCFNRSNNGKKVCRRLTTGESSFAFSIVRSLATEFILFELSQWQCYCRSQEKLICIAYGNTSGYGNYLCIKKILYRVLFFLFIKLSYL